MSLLRLGKWGSCLLRGGIIQLGLDLPLQPLLLRPRARNPALCGGLCATRLSRLPWGELGWSCLGLREVLVLKCCRGESSACGSTRLISGGEQRAGPRAVCKKEVTDLKLPLRLELSGT